VRRVPNPQVDEQQLAALKPAAGAATRMVRVGTLMAMPRLLRETGVDPARTLAEFGLDSARFEDPDNRIPSATEGRILARRADLASWLEIAFGRGEEVLASGQIPGGDRDRQHHRSYTLGIL
jgi:hypothetical protein